jgi:hypothetical protein
MGPGPPPPEPPQRLPFAKLILAPSSEDGPPRASRSPCSFGLKARVPLLAVPISALIRALFADRARPSRPRLLSC